MSTDPPITPELSREQVTALDHVRSQAGRARKEASARIGAVLERASVDRDIGALVGAIATHGSLTLNFHPDRIAADGRLVCETLLEDGVYRNQFETKISNGGLTAFSGGDRDGWEQRLFGGAYQHAGVTAQDRPRYGGLNLMNHPDGPCPRFGSCHLRLGPEVLRRATFCFGDSHMGPRDTGTIDAFEPVLAALLEVTETHGMALGTTGMSVQALARALERGPKGVPSALTPPGRALDDYIEAQIHGPVRVDEHAEALVADPSFMGTPIGATLAAIADRYDVALHWHCGFELNAVDVPSDFRGPRIPVIAERIAREFGDGSSLIHAELLGRAARSVVTDPERWQDRGTPTETLQHIKQLWHVLVQYGG